MAKKADHTFRGRKNPGCKLTRRGEQLARWTLGNLLAHKVEEEGNSEYLDQAEDYLCQLLGVERTEQVVRGIDEEYAGSGYETGED